MITKNKLVPWSDFETMVETFRKVVDRRDAPQEIYNHAVLYNFMQCYNYLLGYTVMNVDDSFMKKGPKQEYLMESINKADFMQKDDKKLFEEATNVYAGISTYNGLYVMKDLEAANAIELVAALCVFFETLVRNKAALDKKEKNWEATA